MNFSGSKSPRFAGAFLFLTDSRDSARMLLMLAIRLQRIGRKNQAHFRVVLTDHKNSAKSGKFLEILGSYNPHGGAIVLESDRIKHWIKQGAQASDTMHNFLVKEGVIEGKKRNVLSKKSPTKKRKELKASK